jgi:ribonuclease HI
MQDTLIIYTDGGCSGNPGPGGWAFAVENGPEGRFWQSGGEVMTTNNRMELTAVRQALLYVLNLGEPLPPVRIITDSQYVKNGITVWIHNWKRNGWRTAGKDPVKNRELWMDLDDLVRHLDVSWHWVKGHAGVELNELCDSLVRKEMDRILLKAQAME